MPGIGGVSQQFFLLGIDRDDGPALSQESLTPALDVAKLGVSIRMLLALLGLGIALQTVMRGVQELGDLHVAQRMSVRRQQASQLACALAGPA